MSKEQGAAMLIVKDAVRELRKRPEYRDLRHRILSMFMEEHLVPRIIAERVQTEAGPWSRMRIDGIRNAIGLFLRSALKGKYPRYKKASYGKAMHDRGTKPTREQMARAHEALGHRQLWTPEQTAFLLRLLLDPLFLNRKPKHERIANIMTAAFPDAQPFTARQCAIHVGNRHKANGNGRGH